jgi:hypothetical protein
MLTHSPTAQPRKLTEVHRGLLIVISWDIQPDFCSGSLNAVLMPYALILTLAPSELTLMSIDQCPESSGPVEISKWWSVNFGQRARRSFCGVPREVCTQVFYGKIKCSGGRYRTSPQKCPKTQPSLGDRKHQHQPVWLDLL